MEVNYTLRKEVLTDSQGNDSVAYGICVHRLSGEIAEVIPHIFTDKKVATDFIELCNTERLELTHLRNVLEDMEF